MTRASVTRISPADVAYEDTGCPLCKGLRREAVVKAPDTNWPAGPQFAVVRCAECGLCYTNPRPAASCIGQFYPEAYGPHQGCGLSRRGRRRARVWGWIPGRIRQLALLRHGLRWHGQGRLLDFGCGNGAFLQMMHLQGWQVTGLDFSPAVVERIREKLGLRTLAGTLPHPQLTPGSFDVITMWHSLEHLHQPLETLRHARDLLAPGGKLMVAVPNIESSAFRWFGREWFCLELPRHLLHFSATSLHAMLQHAGFRVESVRRQGDAACLQRSVRLARSRGRTDWWLRWLAIRRIARIVATASISGAQERLLAVAVRSESSPHDQIVLYRRLAGTQ